MLTRALALVLLLPALAGAQTGQSESCPKSVPNQLTATAKSGEKFAVGFCGEQVDYAEPVLRDAGQRDTRVEARFIRDEAPAENGLFYFATNLLDLPAGKHTLTIDYVKLSSDGETVLAAMPVPLVLTVESATTDPCDGVVVVSVGDWTRTATAGDSAQLFWSVGRSKRPIVKITAFLDGVPVPSAGNNPNPRTADDFRGVLGSNFRVPPGTGTHLLSLEAESDNGCKARDDRLMPLVVR